MPPLFFLISGNTPIAVWGTHLDLIQNPQVRAKHAGKEHINVSPGLPTRLGASLKGAGSPRARAGPPQTLMSHHA